MVATNWHGDALSSPAGFYLLGPTDYAAPKASRLALSPDGGLLALWARYADPQSVVVNSSATSIKILDRLCLERLPASKCSNMSIESRSPAQHVYWTGKALKIITIDGIVASYDVERKDLTSATLSNEALKNLEGSTLNFASASSVDAQAEAERVSKALANLPGPKSARTKAAFASPHETVRVSARADGRLRIDWEGGGHVSMVSEEVAQDIAVVSSCNGRNVVTMSSLPYNFTLAPLAPPDGGVRFNFDAAGCHAFSESGLLFGAPGNSARLIEALTSRKLKLLDFSAAKEVAVGLAASISQGQVLLLSTPESEEIVEIPLTKGLERLDSISQTRINIGDQGRAIPATWYKNDGKGVAVYFHGGPITAGSWFNYLDAVLEILSSGYDCLMVEGSGFAAGGVDVAIRAGTEGPGALDRDSARVAGWVRKRYPSDKAIILGESFGAHAALSLARKMKAAGQPVRTVLIAPWLRPMPIASSQVTARALESQKNRDLVALGIDYSRPEDAYRSWLKTLVNEATGENVYIICSNQDHKTECEEKLSKTGAHIIVEEGLSHEVIFANSNVKVKVRELLK
jgi:alpha/beta superfamily hydrolase